MYIATQHTSETPARAYRIQNDSAIWVELAPRAKVALELHEAEYLIAELTRELNAAKAEARGPAA